MLTARYRPPYDDTIETLPAFNTPLPPHIASLPSPPPAIFFLADGVSFLHLSSDEDDSCGGCFDRWFIHRVCYLCFFFVFFFFGVSIGQG